MATDSNIFRPQSCSTRIIGMRRFWFPVLSLLVLGIIAAACATSRAGYETAPFTVLRTDGAFEIREYPDICVASTPRHDDNSSFMRLFRYIDGDNTAGEKIAMTTPVFMVDGAMAFVLPKESSGQAPAPKNDQIKLEKLKSQTVAVLRFNGARSEKSETEALEKLRGWLRENQLEETGKPFSAYYDPPWTPGLLRRNEVLIPIRPLKALSTPADA